MSMTKYIDDIGIQFFFIFEGRQILVEDRNDGTDSLLKPTGKEIFQKCLEYQIASDWYAEQNHNYAAMLVAKDSPIPQGCKWVPLRSFFAENNPASAKAARAMGILNWRVSNRFCRVCGGSMIENRYESSRRCISCGHEEFPSISPCIIVLIKKQDYILLVKHKNILNDIFTCIAGYMEPGETIEECVAREVMEETGLHIKDIKYVKSQSWPFPDQLMIGFTAEYASGEIIPDKKEIEEARWFKKDKLPQIPKPGSLAWDLINGNL